MTKVTMTFSLDSERDRRILRHLKGLPRGKRSETIREALNVHLGGSGVTLADLYQAVKDLERKMCGDLLLVRADNAGSRQQSAEPDDVAANLDSLGL